MAFSKYIPILAFLCFAAHLNFVAAKTNCFRSVNVVNSTDAGGQNVSTWNSTKWKYWQDNRTEGIKEKSCQEMSKSRLVIFIITEEEAINTAFSKTSKLSNTAWSTRTFPAYVMWSTKVGVRKFYRCTNVYVQAKLDSNKRPIRLVGINKKTPKIFKKIDLNKSCEEVQ